MVFVFDFLGPFSLIVFFIIGIAIGLTIFPVKWLKVNSWVQTVGISLTLFSMGASMAGSPTFLADLRTAGVQALCYALVTIAGSVLLVYLLSRIALKKEDDAE
nr:LysO family transporter [Anaerotruncus rubiinfantis]